MRAQIELPECLVDSRNQKSGIIRSKATHHIQSIGATAHGRLVCMDIGISQIPNLARMIKGSCGKKVWRAMCKSQNVYEILMQAAECGHTSSCRDIVEANINAKTTGHEEVICAIH